MSGKHRCDTVQVLYFLWLSVYLLWIARRMDGNGLELLDAPICVLE
jgi:hypothetical protein